MTLHPRVLAIDIGGTKIASGLVGIDGEVDNHSVASTKQGSDTGDSIAGTVVDIARETCSGFLPNRIGIACAGPVDPTRGFVYPVNITPWSSGYPLKEVLSEAFPNAELTLIGDANAAALGEYRFGAGQGSTSLLGIVVSTGVGGGLVLDGHLHQGASGNAGHIGHGFAGPEFSAITCTCGSSGCVEMIASGPSIEAWAASQGPQERSVKDLAEAARHGDPIAREAFHRAARALAYTVTQTSLTCDLDTLVVGGGVAQAGDVLLEPLRASITTRPGLAFARRIDVRLTRLRQQAGLLGAAAVAMAGTRVPLHPQTRQLTSGG